MLDVIIETLDVFIKIIDIITKITDKFTGNLKIFDKFKNSRLRLARKTLKLDFVLCNCKY